MRVTSTERRKLVAEDLARMNLPEALWRAKVQVVPESVRKTIQNYLDKFDTMAEKGAGLLLWGKPGVGKSGAAAVVAKEARARGYTVYFTTVGDLRDAIREHRMYDESTSVVERCRDVDVLVFDNFQEADIDEHIVNLKFIEELLVGRGNRLQISVMTTRMTWDDLAKHRLFLRTISGYLVEMEVTGEDLREKRGEMLRDVVLGTDKE